MSGNVDLSVIIPALHEAENLTALLPELRSTLDLLGIQYEIILVDRSPDDSTIELAKRFQVQLLDQHERGYGGALVTGFAAASGAYILTMDADFSHPPEFVRTLWSTRSEAEVVIASRYVPGGKALMPYGRFMLSRVLNIFFSRGLDLRVRDMSSGFRLYKADVLRHLEFRARDFDILQEILVKTSCAGWKIIETPFVYAPRRSGSSNARVLAFGRAYLRTFVSLYRLRNSILSADYDDRAYRSLVLPQLYWQRQRFRHITEMIAGQGPTLDVGCGSSRIIAALSEGSVALDILLNKMRYARKFKKALVQGSGFYLPFGDASFPCVLCSQVIEHVPKDSPILDELRRVLAPGGRLVLGTPDYAHWEWNLIEAIYKRVLPSAYADEHISHYSQKELVDLFQGLGYQLEDTRYILRGELILAFRKPSDGD